MTIIRKGMSSRHLKRWATFAWSLVAVLAVQAAICVSAAENTSWEGRHAQARNGSVTRTGQPIELDRRL